MKYRCFLSAFAVSLCATASALAADAGPRQREWAFEVRSLADHQAPTDPMDFGPIERELRPCSILPNATQGAHDTNLWPDNTIPYGFDPNVSAPHQADSINAMSLIEGVSNLHFILRTTEADYIVFHDSTGNNSFIGRVGGPQTINIFNWEAPYVIAHEVMHAMGFYHEQSRPDRGTYVQIESANICQNCCGGSPCDFNFDIDTNAIAEGPYDFDSVMHYGQCFFSTCSNCPANPSSCRTITVLPPFDTMWQDAIGQQDHFSDGDIATMAVLYPPLSEPCDSVHGDLDDDDDVDLVDAGIFETCFGDSTAGRPECSCADKDVDESVDAADVQSFVDAVRGPNQSKGACCDDDAGVCEETTAAECAVTGVTYQGDGIACADVSCPVANPGACCDLSDLSCEETSQFLCDAAGGVYKGDGTTCDGDMCPLEYDNTSPLTDLFPPGDGNAVADDMTLAGTARHLVYYELTVLGQAAPFDVAVQLYDGCPGSGGQPIAGTDAAFTVTMTNQDVVLSHTFDSVVLPDTVWMEVILDSDFAAWFIGGQAEIGSTANVFGYDNPGSSYSCNNIFTGGTPHAGFHAKILCVD